MILQKEVYKYPFIKRFQNIINFGYNYKFGINSNYFKLDYINYFFSYKHNIAKIEYYFSFYDNENNLIFPSDLSLFNNFSIICNIEFFSEKINIDSLSDIYRNKYYKCIEFIHINEKANFNIKIFSISYKHEIYKQFLFNDKIINYNNLNCNNDEIFEYLLINNKYLSFIKKKNDRILNESLKLKSLYLQCPYFSLKRNAITNENFWNFRNLYNYYFCFCRGNNCLNTMIPQKCKYDLYLNIIDKNRNILTKTDYLFVDFIFSELSSDDVYPVFIEMKKQNMPVHYLTEKYEIYKKYCYKIKKCLTILKINRDNYYKNGDFLEKYLTLFLKLKAVISGKYTSLHSISILFFNIEFITYIAVGHGVCYFKHYLFNDYRLYGKKKNNKILIPPSDKLISLVKKHGWDDKDIIKINLPRWDKYNCEEKGNYFLNNSIFIMFTWRDIKKNREISANYITNINNLLVNRILFEELKKNNITVFFTLHRYNVDKYSKKYKFIINNNKNIKYVEQNDISNCLTKSSLVISDFSSIIFDFIYRNKPYIIYIPDADDPEIHNIYSNEYFELIESMSNNSFKFENIFFDINQTINKIIFYINNNYTLDYKLNNFYKSFNLKQGNNIEKFIDYLRKLS